MLSHRQLFLQNIAQTSNAPLLLNIEKAEGIYLYDTEGKKYIDLISGISVSNLGHCYPSVVKAIQNQAEKYMHTMVYGEYVMQPQILLSQLLIKNLPPTLNNVYFVNSGTEAVEGAMKLAKRFTKRKQLISCKNSYHGSTQGAMSLNSSTYFTQNYSPLLPNINYLEYNNFDDIIKITDQTAGVIIEPVQAEAGVINPQEGYLQAVKQRCQQVGALFILDEIQTGYGRTGTLFAFEQQGITPDILLLAKGFGGGLPLGAFVANNNIMSVLSYNPVLGHITTFGGNPVCCAASLATLNELLQQPYLQQVPAKKQLFCSLLKHPKILKIRSAGLLIALELADAETTQQTIKKCKQLGLVTDWFLFADNCLRIAPPLTITFDEIALACQIILDSL